MITCPIERHAINIEEFPLLTKIKLADPPSEIKEDAEVDLLLGSDYYYDFVKTERITMQNGLILLDSEFGYILAGTIEDHSTKTTQLLLTRSQCPDSNFELERLWKLEEVGICDPRESEDDEIALAEFNKTLSFNPEEKRYYVKWPMKEETPEIPNNYQLALGRLKSMINRLQSNPTVLQQYNDIITEQLKKGVIEFAPAESHGELNHYIPHHAVLTPTKTTTKVRIVYDASCKMNKSSPSLNECMHRGPVMLQDLCGLLLRFRTKKVAIVSDVEKAFLQIGLHEPDRNLVRFIWMKDPKQPFSKKNLEHYRFRRVCFGVIASPFLLAAVMAHHLQKINNTTAKDILKNIYVDNVVTGADSVVKAITYYREAKELFKSISMNLREWYSNSNEFMDKIPTEDHGQSKIVKILGLHWETNTDQLSLTLKPIHCSNGEPVTKRIVLRCLAKVFDPCGYFAPITISGKFLLQQLWQRKYAWDDPLPEEFSVNFREHLVEWNKIPDQGIPRYIAGQLELESSQVELHVFCDASTKGFAAAAYLKAHAGSATVSNLIFAKARVCPLKSTTIPRLELTAVYIGTKIAAFLVEELRITVHRKVIWSDSQCVLHWVLGRPVSTRFVKRRVEYIKCRPDFEFKYAPTNENPADLPTSGTNYETLIHSILWWHGPKWLLEDDVHWPAMPEIADWHPQLPTVEPESACITTTVAKKNTENVDTSVFDISRVHALDRAIRVVGYVRRFIAQALKQSNHPYLWLAAEERRLAMWSLIKQAQERHYDRESMNKNPQFSQLGVFLDSQGILRCSTRIQNSDLPDSTQYPILLPQRDGLTELIIQACHQQLMHAGVKHTLAELRYKYWVMRGRSVIKKVLRRCLICKRQRGKPYQSPPEPPLPATRVQGKRAFTTVGIDYLGPLLIYDKSRDPFKAWLCLFTCSLTRAVHLEVVTSMTAEVFLMALRRFMACWGVPQTIITDNAKQFLSAKEALRKMSRSLEGETTIRDFCAKKGIDWKFIIELAPWMGGFYERMVGLTKASLKSTLTRKHLDLQELQTIVTEVTAIINSRPLVYVEDELGDHPLTPNHLTYRHNTLQPFPHEENNDYTDKPSKTEQLILGWKRIQATVEQFWRTWNRQYLTSLREKLHTKTQRNSQGTTPQVGDVVLIGDKNLPRGRWRTGRIVHLKTSNDGKIRSATVRLPNRKTLTRSITALYPLELGGHKSKSGDKIDTRVLNEENPAALDSKQSNSGSSGCDTYSDHIPSGTRPKRNAAEAAKSRIRKLAADDSE